MMVPRWVREQSQGRKLRPRRALDMVELKAEAERFSDMLRRIPDSKIIYLRTTRGTEPEGGWESGGLGIRR